MIRRALFKGSSLTKDMSHSDGEADHLFAVPPFFSSFSLRSRGEARELHIPRLEPRGIVFDNCRGQKRSNVTDVLGFHSYDLRISPSFLDEAGPVLCSEWRPY